MTAAQVSFSAIERALHASASAERVPGAGIAVLTDGDVRFADYGYHDQETARLRDESSRQHVMCLSKVMVAYVALMLVEKGMVSLDESLAEILPTAVRRRGGRRVPITLRQLLCHASGVDDTYERWNTVDTSDLAGYISRLRDYPQIAEPGEVFAYSHIGSAITAFLIEELLGIGWRRAVNTMLLEPLGVTTIPETGGHAEHYGDSVATAYMSAQGSAGYRLVSQERLALSDDNIGSLSICLTVADVATLARFALDDGVTRDGRRLLSAELAREMRTGQIEVPAHPMFHSWGLGWLMFDEQSFGFEAGGEGHHLFMQMFPEERVAMVVLANAYPAFVLYSDVLRATVGRQWPRTVSGPSTVTVDRCAGIYLADGFRLVVTPHGEHLRYQLCKRTSADQWDGYDSGELTPAGGKALAASSARGIPRSAIVPIWSGAEAEPTFIRFGQLLLRRSE